MEKMQAEVDKALAQRQARYTARLQEVEEQLCSTMATGEASTLPSLARAAKTSPLQSADMRDVDEEVRAQLSQINDPVVRKALDRLVRTMQSQHLEEQAHCERSRPDYVPR